MSKPDKAQPTEQEIAQAEVAAEQFEQYKQTGIPLENEWIRRTTGYRMNDDGVYEVDPSAGVRDRDGRVITDTTNAVTANTQAFGRAMATVNPNRLEQAEQIKRDQAQQGASSEAGMALNQQRNANLALTNVVAYGKGMETEALARQSQLSAQAQQDAFTQAQASQANSSSNAYMLGQLGGLAGGLATQRSRLDSFDPSVTPRTPGDHHP